MRQEAVLRVEHFARHAVDAAEVAAIGDRDAKVVHRPAARVDELAAAESRDFGRRRGAFRKNRNDLLHRAVSLGEIIADGV